MIRRSWPILVAMAFSLGACEDSAPVTPPVALANQTPRLLYEVGVDTGGLPVHSVTASAQFDIENAQQCVQPDYSQALGGIHRSFPKTVELRFRENGQGRFVATLVRDPFVDADYFSRGICHWGFTALTITVSGGIPRQQMIILSEKIANDSAALEQIEYCAADSRYAPPPPADYCQVDNENLKPDQRNNLRKVVITTRKVSRS